MARSLRTCFTHGFIESLERRQLFDASVLTNTADIGGPAVTGSYAYVSGLHTLNGGGSDIGSTSDQFRFAWRNAAQDFSISARVVTLSSTDAGAKSGVMMRSVGANAPMAALVITRGIQVKFIYRSSPDALATTVTVPGVTVPEFVRLTRSGFNVSGSYSADGLQWTALGTPQTINFDGGATQAGLAVTARNNAQLATATFTNVAIVGGLNGGWSDADIGVSQGPGSAASDASTDTYTLIAGGTGIGGASDQFNFASRSLTNAGSVVARLETLGTGVEAGVMMRADATPDAEFASVLVSAAGVRFSVRTSSGGPAVDVAAAAISTPVSVKLLRGVSSFQGYYSVDDGATWIRIGTGPSTTVPMPATALAGLAATAKVTDSALATAVFSGVSVGAIASPGAGILTMTDETFLDDLSKRTAQWFAATQNTTSGLFPDRANVYPGWLGGDASMASTGFGLSALEIAASRGWVADAYDRALRTLTFLWNNPEMKNPANHGYFYHFVDQTTGVRSGTSELSTIDTALLLSGVLTAGQYWKGTAVETLANQIYDRVDWPFMQPDGAGKKLRMAWSPESGFTTGTWDSWSEGPLLYLMAMGSATHPISAASWYSFARYSSVSTYAGMTFYHAAGSPLFTNQYPQGWFDLRDRSDLANAAPTGPAIYIDPYQNSKLHTLAQRRALIDAAAGPDVRYDSYSANAWGLTASDSATGYQVFGGPPLSSNVDGTIAPTAPGGSLAFTPRESLDCLQNLKATYPQSYKTYGFVDAFNPRPTVNWYDNDAIGIDQGMILVAAENLRSGFVWNLFMSHPAAQRAVAVAFSTNASLAPPSLAASAFRYESGQALSLTFAQDVTASLDVSDLLITNLTTGQVVAPPSVSLSLNNLGGATSATVTFTSMLADGNYELRMLSNSVASSDGTANVNDLVVPFFVLAGDANRDRRVDFSDLLILAQNFGSPGRSFSQGNFDYSVGGVVGFSDLLILAQRFDTNFIPAIAALNSSQIETRRPRHSNAGEVL